MTAVQYFTATGLLGAIVRNSEFDNAEVKTSAARLHIGISMKTTIFLTDILDRLISRMAAGNSQKSNPINPESAASVRYALNKMIIGIMARVVAEQGGTEKLFPIYENMYNSESGIIVERFCIAVILLELGHPKWHEFWLRLIDETRQTRFILDILLDRLWEHVRSKALSNLERDHVENALISIELALGTPKSQKSTIIKQVTDAANSAATDE